MTCTWEKVRQILQSEMQEKFMKAANPAQQARGDIDKMPWLPWLCVLYAHGPTSLCICEAGTESQHDHLILIAVVQRGMRFFGERSIAHAHVQRTSVIYFHAVTVHAMVLSILDLCGIYQFMEKKYFTVSMYYHILECQRILSHLSTRTAQLNFLLSRMVFYYFSLYR